MTSPVGSKSLERLFPALISALESQIILLSEAVLEQAEFDKKSIDNMLAITKAISSVRELVGQSEADGSQDDNDSLKLRDIINELEDRIDQLAKKRADQLVAERPDGKHAVDVAQQGTIAAADRTATATSQQLDDLAFDGGQGFRKDKGGQ